MRGVRTVRQISLVFVVCGLGALHACGAAYSRPLTPAEEMELRTLTGQLADPARSAKTKLEAASLLLTRPYPQAVESLRGFLAQSTDRSAQIVVAEAVAQYGGEHEEFIEPLMDMLTGKEPSVRAPAARALVTYKNHGITDKLIAITLDAKRDNAVRLVTIESLPRVLDKRAVDALVQLLDAKDAALRDAALSALAKLTNIRAFGKDRQAWKRWWRRNKDKDRSQWLADLAESLGRAKADLEVDNARLQKRLVQAMLDLYAATAAARHDGMLLSFLKDPLGEVRLVGLMLTDRKVSANEDVSDEIRSQIRTMLADADPRVRRSSALLVAALGDGEALAILLERLRAEDDPSARAGVLAALGRLADPKALSAVLAEIPSKYDEVAAAATTALRRIASAQPLAGASRRAAAEALVARYRLAQGGTNGGALREALLSAMGVIGDADLAGVLADALKDPAATVRLAAVNGLARMGRPGSATALVSMVADSDRGVRRAVVAALGALGGQEHLGTILQRTDPTVEADAAVRQHAWDVAMAILAKADANVLASVAAALSKRPDAGAKRIEILQKLVESLRAGGGDDLAAAQRRLGLALLKAGRPVEAAEHLAKAYAALDAAGNDETPAVWLEWLDALFAAGDPAGLMAMAEKESEADFAKALKGLNGRLGDLMGEKNYAPVVLLAGEALKQLPQRLTVSQRRDMEKLLAEARGKQLAIDRKNVSRLVGQLLAADEAARAAASAELRNLGDRAVRPLLDELRNVLGAAGGGEESEKAILAVLRQIAPKLTGYDAAAPVAKRLETVNGWIRSRGAADPGPSKD